MESSLKESGNVEDGDRPFHDLLLALPQLAMLDGQVDWANTPVATLKAIAVHADVAMRTAQLGLRAMGQLLVLGSPEAETGELTGATVEAFGWLMAELSDFAATCGYLATCCQRHLPAADGLNELAAEVRVRAHARKNRPRSERGGLPR